MSEPTLIDNLKHEILMARKRIYAIAPATPINIIRMDNGGTLFLKREDLGPIHAYKWRGAYNRMAMLSPEELSQGVIAASAGNHAQGVALAAKRLETTARIYMPLSTPRMKQQAVRNHGGNKVEIILTGDTYDAASEAAKKETAESGKTFIHPYDDLLTMAGQGTLADEIVMSGHGPFDIAFLQIGGGGMAAAVALWLKTYYPGIHIVGVEGVDQASMKAAVAQGGPVTLDYVDVFCDGTAVKRVGDLTYQVCREVIDEFVTVTNAEVCTGIQFLWEKLRCIPEPAGAMGLAAALKLKDRLAGKKVVNIVCGANMDFGQLALISRSAGIGFSQKHYFRFKIDEKGGSLLALLEDHLKGLNIFEFQYGKADQTTAYPVIGFEASPGQYDHLRNQLEAKGIRFEDVTAQEDIEFRIIHYKSELMNNPYFIKLEFHERTGALVDFMRTIQGRTNLCYFSYAATGERVGRALIGFEFSNPEQRASFIARLERKTDAYRSYHEVPENVLHRIL